MRLETNNQNKIQHNFCFFPQGFPCQKTQCHMDLAKLPAWSSHRAAVMAPAGGDPCCGHTGPAACCLLLGFRVLHTSAAKPLSLSIVRHSCHRLPLLSGSPDPTARPCSVLHRPNESHPTHSNSQNTSDKELHKRYKPLSQHKTSTALGQRGHVYTPFPAAWSTATAPSTCHNLVGEGMLLTYKSYPYGFGTTTRLKNKSNFC